MKLRQANKQVGESERQREREREQQKKQQHALLILKSIADWGRYILCHSGVNEGRGKGKQKETKY